jgi:hypothetical protein
MGDLATERFAVPGLVNQDKLKSLVEEKVIIRNGDIHSIEGVKYDFRIGPSFLKSRFRRPVEFDRLQDIDSLSGAEIEPGEVVFVMTKEQICLPTNMMIVLTHKGKIATTSEIFPDDLVRLITNYQPVNLSSVTEKLTLLEGQFKALNDQLMTSREWQEKFENNLTKIETETSKVQDETAKIAVLLKEEVADRKEEVRTIRESVKRTEEKIGEVDKKTAVVEERRSHNSRILWAILAFMASLLAGIIGFVLRDVFTARPQFIPPPPSPSVTQTPQQR